MIHNLERKLDDILHGDSLSESYSSSSYPAAADSDPTAAEEQQKKMTKKKTEEDRVAAGAASTVAEQREKDQQHHKHHSSQLPASTQPSTVDYDIKAASSEGGTYRRDLSGRGNTTFTHPYPLNRNLSIEKASSTVICTSNISF